MSFVRFTQNIIRMVKRYQHNMTATTDGLRNLMVIIFTIVLISSTGKRPFNDGEVDHTSEEGSIYF